MYSLEWLIASISTAAVIGAFIGYWISASSSTKKQAEKLEADLAESRASFEAYRKEVFDEFSETASKFKSLNASYVDLHQHLARSANTLCGETAASILIDAPGMQASHDDIDVAPDEPSTTLDSENNSTTVEEPEAPNLAAVHMEFDAEPEYPDELSASPEIKQQAKGL